VLACNLPIFSAGDLVSIPKATPRKTDQGVILVTSLRHVIAMTQDNFHQHLIAGIVSEGIAA
jgi:hypothetical protein